MKRYILFSLIIGLVISCKETKLAQNAQEELGEDVPEAIFTEISTLYSEDTKIIFKIDAKTQYKYQNGNERFPDGIDIEMFTKEGEKKSTLVADSGVYSQETNLYTVMGNVVVVDLLGNKQLKCDLLNWKKDSSIVYTDRETDVEIIDEGQKITGKGLRAQQDFSDYEIYDIKGVTTVD